MTTTIRAFIAIDLPTAIHKELGAAARKLGQAVPGRSIRWVRPPQIHLTLAFLGDTAPDRLPALAVAIDEVTTAIPRFQLALGPAGCFPNCRQPRVIWVGLEGDLAPLLTLKANLDEALRPLGWPPEKRPFRPHLTLGRVRQGATAADVPVNRVKLSGRFGVAAVHLFESELRPDGPRYTVRHSSLLGLTAP